MHRVSISMSKAFVGDRQEPTVLTCQLLFRQITTHHPSDDGQPQEVELAAHSQGFNLRPSCRVGRAGKMHIIASQQNRPTRPDGRAASALAVSESVLARKAEEEEASHIRAAVNGRRGRRKTCCFSSKLQQLSSANFLAWCIEVGTKRGVTGAERQVGRCERLRMGKQNELGWLAGWRAGCFKRHT